ncbi:MAG: DegV family protein [Clostridia bacterium]|nr:DegV family protein [Clostridia bacterium]
MDRKFNLSCCSNVDLPYSYMQGRDIPVYFNAYAIGETEYVDDMQRTPGSLDSFYATVAAGAMPHTSQINEAEFVEYFEGLLATEGDWLHITFSSGLSNTAANAFRAAEAVMESHPGRRIVVVDSLAASSGFGMLVDYAADMRDAGKSLDEVAAWLNENRTKLHHQFYCSDLTHFRRSGRVTGLSATLGTILGICPIMRVNAEGGLSAYDKVRGKKKAVSETVKVMVEHAQNGTDYDGKCFICHSCCPEEAELMRASIEAKFPKLKDQIRICRIGCVIGSHCGPSTVALFFMGDERPKG